MSHFLSRASSATRIFFGAALLALLAACGGGNAVTTGAVGDDSDGSVLIVSTFAGKAGEPGYVNGQGSDARLRFPLGITVDGAGNVYVGDNGNFVIRKITPAGNVTTVAGTPGVQGNQNGPAATAKFMTLSGLAVDTFSNVYLVDNRAHNVRKLDLFGNITVYAGSEFGVTGNQDGFRTDAGFESPYGIAVAQNLTVDVITPFFTGSLRSISAQGTVTTLLGVEVTENFRQAVALDSVGNRYLLRRDGAVEKLEVGKSTPSAFSSGLGHEGTVVNFAVDKNTNTFIINGNAIQKISANGSGAVFAGSVSNAGYVDGLLSQARFRTSELGGVAVAPDGTLYVADSKNHTIRKISKGFYVGGVVRGLNGSGKVILQNNNGASQSISQNGSFTFSMPVAQSATYTAQILSAEGHSCSFVGAATGQVTTTVSSIVVDCAPIAQPPQYSAGGTVSGLTGDQQVVLINGQDKTLPLGNGAYTFLVKASSGTTYNVKADTQPIGRTCSVANGNSSINNANVVNVNVSCVTSTHSIAGNVIGLGSGTVGVAINSSPTQTISSNGRFTLTNTINYGSNFDVNIISQPVGQTCALNGLVAIAASSARVTGTVAGDVSLNLTCRTNTYTVTAAVTGTSAGETVSLQLTGNPGGTQTLLLTGSGSGAFTSRVSHGASVNLAVLSSPAGKTCSLTSPASITVTGASNVTVNCTVNAPVLYTVGGTVSGLPLMTTIDLLMASSDFASNQMATGNSNGAYQFLTAVPSGSTISIAATSPIGYSCTVASPYATGALVSGNVTNANVSCVSTGGGGGGGFTPGTVNGQVTNNGPDTRTILVENGVNQVAVVVNSNSTANFTIPGQLAQGVSYTVTASDVTMPTPGSGLLNCGVNNGTGNMVALPGAVSNVSVTCQVAPP